MAVQQAPATAVRQRRKSVSEQAADAVKDIEERVERALTILWDDLQPWQQDNHFILSGYRPASASFRRSLASLTHLHNESVNIYTHLGGAVAALGLGAYVQQALVPRYASSTRGDVLVFAVFVLAAATCLGMSATYHTISNHSEPVARFGNRLDYLGIVVLIVGSFVPTLYYAFYCHPALMRWYCGLICSLGAVTALVCLHGRFRSPRWRPFRASLFIALGVSAVIPLSSALRLYTLAQLDARLDAAAIAAEAALYIFGAVLYAARVPERWCPGRFDLLGSSHQIFHAFVLAAAAAHLRSCAHAFDWVHRQMQRGTDVCA